MGVIGTMLAAVIDRIREIGMLRGIGATRRQVVQSLVTEAAFLGFAAVVCGVIGGVPQSGLDFGAAVNTEALIHQNQQFDFYDGGGLDMACLGMAECDADGNVNVSRFGPKLAGAGGFINITQNARRLVFAGTFTAGGLDVEVKGGQVRIKKEGRSRKFVKKVEQVTFSGAYAAEKGQPVLYVTERCIFRRTAKGMELAEVAPGIDIERDILAHMDFKPIVNKPGLMDARIFFDEPMQLDETLLGLGLAQRVTYDPKRNVMFLNMEGMHIKTRDDVDRVRRVIEERAPAIGKKFALVVNYDGCFIDAAVADTYAAMVRYMETHYYTTASRYTTSAFLRLKLGEALAKRRVKPHIFETHDEADAAVEGHDGTDKQSK
jgi:propionate CoA-transferase